MPGTALALTGSFTMAGTATATALANMTIGGTVTLGSGTTFNGSSFTHNVTGDWIKQWRNIYFREPAPLSFNATFADQKYQRYGGHSIL